MGEADFSSITQEFDDALIAEFSDELRDAIQELQELLVAMESDFDLEQVDDLFRRVHSIKSNLRMVGFDDLAEYIHRFEDVLDALRGGGLSFDETLSDVLLLGIYKAQGWAEDRFGGTPTPEEMERVGESLHHLAAAPSAETLAATHRLLEDGAGDDPACKADLNYFELLAKLSEQRSPFWMGRHERVLRWAGDMNRAAGTPVDPLQLRTAVYLHDFMMTLLPLETLHKPEMLAKAEKETLGAHPATAALLLQSLPAWAEAARIIEQHHEWFDGSGYPVGLAGEAVCDGAKILAIADTFEAVTNERAHRYPRPTLRAVAEINSGRGTQFDPRWVDVFNSVFRETLRSRSV